MRSLLNKKSEYWSFLGVRTFYFYVVEEKRIRYYASDSK